MNVLKQVGKIALRESEINILNKYNIQFSNCNSLDEVLFLIDHYIDDTFDLSDEEYEELDTVARDLSERKYYMETNK